MTRCQALIGGGDDRHEISSRVDHEGNGLYRHSLLASLESLELQVDQAFARKDGLLACESYRSEARHDGKVVSREEGYFQGTKHLQFGGVVSPFPNDVAPLIGCMIALRGLDFSRGYKRSVELWLAFSVF